MYDYGDDHNCENCGEACDCGLDHESCVGCEACWEVWDELEDEGSD